MTEQHPYPDGPPDSEHSQPEAGDGDGLDPVAQSDPLDELGRPEGEDSEPDGAPRTSPSD